MPWPASPTVGAWPSSSAGPGSTSGRSPGVLPPTRCRATRSSGHGSRPNSSRTASPALAERLRTLAPELAQRVDLRNPRRVVRALEIAELRGDTTLPSPRGYPGRVTWLGLEVTPAVHRARIVERARGQFAAGLLDEARLLREQFDPGLPAFSAIGYREAWAVIDGQASIEEAIELDIQRNVAFAKRQRTWFRAEPDIAWLDAETEPLGPARAAVEELLNRHRPSDR